MIQAGYYQTLRVGRFSDYGVYLNDEEMDDVLLPNRYVPEGVQLNDMIDVFVYHDSEDRLVATTEKPLAACGEVAYLEVVGTNFHGAFLNWGLPKDLFVPKSNQLARMEVGRKYVVYLYNDNVSGRMVATAKLNSYVNNQELTVEEKTDVNVMVASENEVGFRCVINNRHWGIIYKNQVFQPLHIGDKMDGNIRKITEDNRIDIALQMEGFNEVKKSADRILDLIKNNNGKLEITERHSPEEIYAATHMSKKVFKKSIGYLWKQHIIEFAEDGIVLKVKE